MILVAHDPGHGRMRRIDGKLVLDNGTPARIDVDGDGDIDRDDSEAALVLGISRSIIDGLPAYSHVLLRDGPVGPSYQQRAAKAKERGADLALLHHINAYEKSEAAHGLKAFYLPDDTLGYETASAIARAAPHPLFRGAATPATSRDWARVVWVLSHYASVGMPCVLIEWGFATNARDREVLVDPLWRPALVACAAAGIAHAGQLVLRGRSAA
jgi:N-acetylmuramoyl-L-alanine amidase